MKSITIPRWLKNTLEFIGWFIFWGVIAWMPTVAWFRIGYFLDDFPAFAYGGPLYQLLPYASRSSGNLGAVALVTGYFWYGSSTGFAAATRWRAQP